MFDEQNLNSIQEALNGAKNILILSPANPSLDSIAASLALYLSLKKQGKQVLAACPSSMTVAFNRLIGVNKITDRVGGRNLIISFDYLKDSIEKVSYNIESEKFNLVVEPKAGCPPLETDKVSYSYAGSEADLVFIIGALKLEDLDRLYFNEKGVFDNSLTVNIDNRANNTKFGKVNLVNPQSASCCEILTLLIKRLNLPIDPDTSSNLLAGIEANTSNFQASATSADTFEAAAWCLKNGAKRKQFVGQRPMPPAQAPFITPQAATPKPPQIPPITPSPKPTQPPPDWLKPKVYKGNSLV